MAHLEYNSGDIIFNEGDESREAYYIAGGNVDISIRTPGGERVLGRLGKGEIFGEMGMVADRPRSASATAVGETKLESFDEAVFEDYILAKPDRVKVFMATLFERLRTTDALLQAELQKHGGGPGEAPTVEVDALTALESTVGEPEATPVEEESVGIEATVSLRSLYEETGFPGEAILVEVDTFPYRIGRAFDDQGVALFAHNNLSVTDKMPYHVSRNHCEIGRDGESLFVRDRGSSLGTLVNEEEIGMRTGKLTARLVRGENDLVLGTVDGPHHFVVTVA
ncbi:MAG: cyclic nucleotide-binding domain-containing protein [Verrucomicrobiota bacterium]